MTMLFFHWYGAMYVAAFWLGWGILPWLAQRKGITMSREVAMYVAASVAVGVIIGGRLGYVFLYEPHYFWLHPVQILSIWQGGMAFHGGLVGAGLVLLLVARRLRIPFLALTDIAAVPAAVGLMLGRIGNFINGELYVGNFALLAASKDALIAGVCGWFLWHKNLWADGKITGVFLVMYAVLRFVTEYVRVNEWGLVGGLTWGQWYTIPVFLVGIYLLTKLPE